MRTRARRTKCPWCKRDVSIKTDGTIRPHINYGDEARTGNCHYSGFKVDEDLRPLDEQDAVSS